MKRLLFLSALFIVSPLSVKALENVNLNVVAEFQEDVPIEKISSIYLELDDVNGSNHFVEVYKEDDFKGTIESFPNGEITINAASIDQDYINEYPISYTIDYQYDHININLIVSKRELKVTNPEDRIKYDEKYIEQVYGKYYTEMKEKYENAKGTTSVTITTESGEQITAEVPKEESSTTTNNLVDKEQEENEQKEENQEIEEKKKNIVFKILFIVLGILVFVTLIFAIIKIKNANK